MMGWNPLGYGYGMMAGGWLGMLLELALLVLAVYVLVRIFSHTPSTVGHDRALELLRERYARGELDQATFEQMKGALQTR